jgi:hypothetical protein
MSLTLRPINCSIVNRSADGLLFPVPIRAISARRSLTFLFDSCLIRLLFSSLSVCVLAAHNFVSQLSTFLVEEANQVVS